ncbi:MAG TPA: hypothetical protein ENI69_00625 [Rhodospirillales bacterium]|nr:hypothetical protein [Rhodospirillales bacterium]
MTSAVDDQEHDLLLRQMAQTLCRQYIMWLSMEPLPCQQGIDCDKSDKCRAMAEEVIDYTKDLAPV